MNVSFASADPFNSKVIDDASGDVLFEVETPSRLLRRRTTTVWTARRKVVGVYERNWGRNKVVYLGESRRLAEWLPKESKSSSSRTFIGPNNKAYTWKLGPGATWKLVDSATQAAIAESRYTTRGVSSHAVRHIGIDVGAELIPFLDAVILSYLICEDERRDSSDQQSSDIGDFPKEAWQAEHVVLDAGLQAAVIATAGIADVSAPVHAEANADHGAGAGASVGMGGDSGNGHGTDADPGPDSSLGASAIGDGGGYGADAGGYGGDAGVGE